MPTDTLFVAVTPLDSARRRLLERALEAVVSPAQLCAAQELQRACDSGGREPHPEEILYWMRLNMPAAAARVEEYLHPND